MKKERAYVIENRAVKPHVYFVNRAAGGGPRGQAWPTWVEDYKKATGFLTIENALSVLDEWFAAEPIPHFIDVKNKYDLAKR